MYKPANAPVLQLFSLKGKVAVVTGGVRGIGLAAAQALAEAGAHVALVYATKGPEFAQSVADTISRDTGVTVRHYKADVSVKDEISRCLAQITADFGRLDIVVANSGINVYGPGESIDELDYRRIMGVNLDGAFFTAQAAYAEFDKQIERGTLQQGNLIFTASVSSLVVNIPQLQATYNASKAAVVRMAKSLAVEWIKKVRVNCVSPGYIETDMISTVPDSWTQTWFRQIPAERMGQPYELKGMYVYLASDASSYMTGEELVIDGAFTVI